VSAADADPRVEWIRQVLPHGIYLSGLTVLTSAHGWVCYVRIHPTGRVQAPCSLHGGLIQYLKTQSHIRYVLAHWHGLGAVYRVSVDRLVQEWEAGRSLSRDRQYVRLKTQAWHLIRVREPFVVPSAGRAAVYINGVGAVVRRED
jgi:hypothetical protein